MTDLRLTDANSIFKARDIASRTEAFSLLVEGKKVKWVKKVRPMVEYIHGPGGGKFYPKKSGFLTKAIKFMFYNIVAGDFMVIYHFAMKAGMKAKWEETDTSIIITFEPDI